MKFSAQLLSHTLREIETTIFYPVSTRYKYSTARVHKREKEFNVELAVVHITFIELCHWLFMLAFGELVNA